jgi:hypothetical protein
MDDRHVRHHRRRPEGRAQEFRAGRPIAALDVLDLDVHAVLGLTEVGEAPEAESKRRQRRQDETRPLEQGVEPRDLAGVNQRDVRGDLLRHDGVPPTTSQFDTGRRVGRNEDCRVRISLYGALPQGHGTLEDTHHHMEMRQPLRAHRATFP